MADNRRIVRERQMAVRRELDRRGIHLKAAAFDSHVPEATLRSYFPLPGGERDPADMPASALFALVAGHALPLDLLSLLLPDQFLIVRVADGVDHDQASAAMRDYLHLKDCAHHPESPAGREISGAEDDALRAQLAGVNAANVIVIREGER